MLSNTAVPKYYGQFREAVINGEIPVNEMLSLEMNRIDSLIENPGIYYDPEPVEKWIKFCESELTLTDGSDLVMLDSFKLWGEQLFGWYYFIERMVYVKNGYYKKVRIKKRLILKQYLIVGRGAGKSMYATCVHAYGLVVDPETTAQVATSFTMTQAEETLNPLRTAIYRSRGPLFKFLTEGSLQNTTGSKAKRMKLASTKKGIENFITNSILEVKPMSVDKLQGYRNKYSSIDEWLSGDVKEDVVNAIEQGATKLDDYIMLLMSSEGTVRNGIGDTIKKELMSILKGEYINPHVSIFWYRLDSSDEVGNPEMWIKANPNIGKIVSYEAYQLDVERAEKVPSARNDILAKRFGIPTEGYTYFFPYEETLPHKFREYWGMQCALGADLSRGDDFCSFGFLFPTGDSCFGIKTLNYITEKTYEKLPYSIKEKYKEFLAEKSLVIMPGVVLDMPEVYDDLMKYIQEKNYDVVSFGFDPYNAADFINRWVMEHGEYGITKVIQGRKTESVPLGELKLLSEDRRLLFDQSIFSFAMGNCIVIEDTNGNRKLYKDRSDKKIDPFASIMDAYISYKENRDMYE